MIVNGNGPQPIHYSRKLASAELALYELNFFQFLVKSGQARVWKRLCHLTEEAIKPCNYEGQNKNRQVNKNQLNNQRLLKLTKKEYGIYNWSQVANQNQIFTIFTYLQQPK